MRITKPEKPIQHYISTFDMTRFLNDDLLNNLRIFHFPAYSNVYIEEAEQYMLYFLVEGQVQCSHYHLNGKLAVIALSNPFEVIGEIEIFNEDRLHSNVIATQRTVMLGIERDIVRRYGTNDPQFLHFLIDQLKVKLYRTNALQMNQVLPLISRLSLYLLSQSLNKDNSFVLPAKEELASLMGTTTRHLNRVLKQLVESGCVSSGYPLVKILDRLSLQDFAHQ